MTTSNVKVELDAEASMRDGTVLRADVYRPVGGGPWPTLLTRTPYGKAVLGQTAWSGLDPVHVADQGFVVVIQDTRGRFASEGDWAPFEFEGPDGYDSVEWAAKLPGSNGRVGLYGGSYCGSTQWMAAIEKPPSLAAISPLMTWSEPCDGVFARGGAVELGLDAPWALINGLDWLGRLGLSAGDLSQRLENLVDEFDSLGHSGYRELPVGELGLLRRHQTPDLGTIRSVTQPSVAGACRVAGRHDQVDVPSFQTGGWYDLFLQGTLDNHVAMSAVGRDSRLLVGPWSHIEFAESIGELAFGLRSYRDGLPVHPHGNWIESQLAFMRRHVSPDTDIDMPAAPVRIFVMGRNEWRDEAEWPPARAEIQRWFLQPDLSLGSSPPAGGEATVQFSYDPADPVPTVGGHTVMIPGHPPGPRDQAAIEAREDLLVFTSLPVRGEMEVTGRIRAVLEVESSAPSTDWVVRLCDVHPDGRSINLCDGIFRDESAGGGSHRVEIDLWSTSTVFLPGHRLRVHVTSSSFPRWDRNLNTGRQSDRVSAVARQRLHLGAAGLCFLELPVIPAESP